MSSPPLSITVSSAVIRKLKRELAIEWLGRRWLLHEANRVQRLPQPLKQGREHVSRRD